MEKFDTFKEKQKVGHNFVTAVSEICLLQSYFYTFCNNAK